LNTKNNPKTWVSCKILYMKIKIYSI
jgi:hypothetical protein